jgi:xanthine dehydrogenase accessory factor
MNNLIIVRGGGDLASGAILKLHRCGFRVLVLESDDPSCIRRTVSFGDSVHSGSVTLEGTTAVFANSTAEIGAIWDKGQVPVLSDESGFILSILKPMAVIDAIIAKKNLGTSKKMAPITIALGPGFEAGVDVDTVIETNRGHDLGRLIFEGTASENTGIPGVIGGFGAERVIYSSREGKLTHTKKIGDRVAKGETIASIDGTDVAASIDGVLRGLIREGSVPEGMKIADIDPREGSEGYCFTISDKANALGGAVLEALLIGVRKHGFSLDQ